MALWRGTVILICLAAGGCIPRESQSIGAIDPSASIPAMQEAARKKDSSAVPALIGQLGSDDAAVRFYAIEALRSITGKTMDYQYYDDPDHRKQAIERWRKWLAEQKTRRHGDAVTR